MIYFDQIDKGKGVVFVKLSDIRKLTQQLSPSMNRADASTRNALLRSLGYEPGNLYQELEMESRFVDTHQDVSWSNLSVSLHSHTFYEILCCRNTCGAEYLVGSERYRLQKGDIIFVPPGVSHRPLLPENMSDPYTRDVLWISTEFVDICRSLFSDSFSGAQRRSSLLRTAGTKWEYLSDLFRAGVQEAEGGAPGWESAVIGNTMVLMTHLARAFFDRTDLSLSAERPELLDRAMAYMEENLARKITLSDAARYLYVSESTVSQAFRNKMGVSFHQCLTQRRLIAAKQLIVQDVLLENVGQLVGFPDYSTFYRAFKKQFGISPRQYRKLQEDVLSPE